MRLTSLAYYSSMALQGPHQVNDILKTARKNNKIEMITGSLVYDGQYFLQVLEGARTAVTDLFLRISNDPRHLGCRLMTVVDIPERRFSDWEMGFVDLEMGKRDLIKRYSSVDNFLPEHFESRGFVELIHKISNTPGAVVGSATLAA